MVDDHPTVRAGIRSALAENGVAAVVEADSLAGARRVVTTSHPDVVLLDLGLGRESGMRAVPEFATGSGVLVHTMHSDLATEALSRGALGFVAKTAPVGVLVAAVRAVAAGRRYLDPALAADLATGLAGRSLSARERQVLELLADGLTNRQVAGVLSISVRTVENIRASLRNRLGLVDRADLVAYARRAGR
ncbi:response regulator transcription factor [Amycolatopsis sp. FBCC-B4732]|uniref:response regulator n=1 Tax=Amycolatopsis sp. FBCC-B4732 TaxID=3079339 RepID=UPI001FF0EFE6|nr:response regulator transcription factor [Amycolatopsis sp. FBCC-B4732]UOX93055.1 response regulator transcription factor [Amycolatopsis sp. FBCC-B4732]